jgi:hypothetical protein
MANNKALLLPLNNRYSELRSRWSNLDWSLCVWIAKKDTTHITSHYYKIILAMLHETTRFLHLEIFLLTFRKDFGYEKSMDSPDVLERLA